MPSPAQYLDLRRTAESMRWYHTLELPGGITTAGEYDLRAVAPRLPWGDIEGKRCLDVGSRDGFYAFEMERRGAAEVVSLDINDPARLDLPVKDRASIDRELVSKELDDGNRAFEVAREALGSSVERRFTSVYDLDPETDGTFDFAVVGTLLLHLRDPVGAMQAIRGVAKTLLVINPIDLNLSTYRRRPIVHPIRMDGPFWWQPNIAGLRWMIERAGFDVFESSGVINIPRGAGGGGQSVREVLRGPRSQIAWRLIMLRRLPHIWMLAR